MAAGPSSDAENDRLGRPREGEISPAGPKPHFVNLVGDLREYAPGQDRVIQANAAWHPDNANYIPPAAFEPAAVNLGNVVFGWFADLKDDWYPVLPCTVRRLSLRNGVVEAVIDEETRVVVANFGSDRKAYLDSLELVPEDPAELETAIVAAANDTNRQARCFRAMFAAYLAQAGGYDFSE